MSTHRLRLQRTKVKEMEARPFRGTCDVDEVHRSCMLFFMLLEDRKLLSGED